MEMKGAARGNGREERVVAIRERENRKEGKTTKRSGEVEMER